MDRNDFHKLIMSVVAMSLALTMLGLLFKDLKVESDFEKELAAVHSGKIIDKKIVNPKTGLFTSHGTEYYIIIDTDVKKQSYLEELTKQPLKIFQ
jgi:hypothetical protein